MAGTRGPRTYATGLRRDLDVLTALAEHRDGALGVARLAEAVGRDPSQVSRALAALAEEGLVDRDAGTGRYRLGWRLYALAAQTAEAHLAATATPFLQHLVARLGETVHLCVLRGAEVLTVASESPSHAFRAVGWAGFGVPAATTSAGRVLVADWGPDVLRSWFSAEHLGPGFTAGRLGPGAPRTVEALIDEVAAIAARGYAVVEEEFEVGVVGASAPVRDARGSTVAALNVVGPAGRLGARLDAAGQVTAAVAAELSAALAEPPVPPVRR